MPKIRDRAPLSKLKKKTSGSRRGSNPGAMQWRQSPFTMNNANIGSLSNDQTYNT